jgi:non-ribosomal peptide synthetase component F
MRNLAERLANLTPEQREVLLRLLEEPRARRTRGRGGFPVIELRPEERYDPFPLTDVQQVYWAGRSGLFDLGTCGTNVYSRLEIGGFDEPPLERIDHMFRRLVDHHEMLRAVVLADGRQRILAEVPPYRTRVEDLRAFPAEAIEEHLRLAKEEMRYGRQPIDRWPLFDNLVQLLPGGRLCLHMSFQTLLIDGTSRLRMLHEVIGLLRHPDLVLNPVECSYRDYALACEELRNSEPYQRSRAYWIERLPTLPPAPRLPYAPPVGPATPTRFASWSHAFTRDQWRRLKARATELGLTPSATFIAAVAEVLALWSRQADFTLYIESTYHPPVHPGIETVLGNFNSCIPLPVDRWLGGFAARAVRLQEEIQRGLEHQHFPGFEVIREINRRKGGTSAAALPVQVNSVIEYNQPSYRRKVAVKNQPAQPSPAQNLVVTQSEFGVSFPQFILMVTAFENPDDTMALAWQAAAGALPPVISAAMFNALVALVERLAEDEPVWHAQRWELARLLLPERRHKGHSSKTSTGALQDAFFERARLHPERPAVGEGARTISYSELAVRALRIGRNVRQLGAGEHRLAGVLADSRIEAIAAILGILAAEAGFVILPPALSRQALSSLVRGWGIGLLVIDSSAAEGMAGFELVPVLGTDAAAPEGESRLDPGGAGLAYLAVDFESARPRAAMMEHEAAVQGTTDLAQRLGLSEKSRWVAVTGWEGGRFILELFAALSAGAMIVFPDPSEIRDPARLAERLLREGTDVWSSGPALFESVVTELEAQPIGSVESPRLAVVHGGPVAASLPNRLVKLGIRLLDLEIVPEMGGPASDETSHVLNEELEHCPDWVIGDLYLGGPMLGKGYWNDPDATLSRFVLHPRTGERLLRTGKLARLRPEGRLEILGDLREVEAEIVGYHFEVRLVEAKLECHPLVRVAVVLVEEGFRGRKQLAAHVIRRRGSVLQEEDLRNWLAERLPYYMVPAWLSIDDALPIMADGSVDRQALETIDRRERRLAPGNERSEIEVELASIWREILGRKDLGIQDDFFATGGDSIKLVQMLNRVQLRWPLERPLWEIFHEPTVEHLARLIRRRTKV